MMIPVREIGIPGDANLYASGVAEEIALLNGRLDAALAAAWKPAFNFFPSIGLFLMVLFARLGRPKPVRVASSLTTLGLIVLGFIPAMATSVGVHLPSYALYNDQGHFLALTDDENFSVNGSVAPYNIIQSNRYVAVSTSPKVNALPIRPNLGLGPDALLEHASLTLLVPYYLLCCNITKYVREIRNWHPRPLILENRNSPTKTQGQRETSKNRGATNATNMKPNTSI